MGIDHIAELRGSKVVDGWPGDGDASDAVSALALGGANRRRVVRDTVDGLGAEVPHVPAARMSPDGRRLGAAARDGASAAPVEPEA
jgi:hypothetical protein